MKIPEKQLKRWKELREQGDMSEMEERSIKLVGKKIFRQHLTKAFKEGISTVKAYELMRKFYTERENLINQ